MHPIKQLQKLIREPHLNKGRIISAIGSSIIVSTPKGSYSVQKNLNDLTNYKIGDHVLLSNGQIIGKRSNDPKTYVL